MSRVVVLVEPENPRNIGFVARAMYTNGLTELRVVDSSIDKIHQDALITATSGRSIIESAKIYPSLKEATKSSIESVGFSRRDFNNEPIHLELPQLPSHLPKEGEVALVFGRESQGLNVEELSFCTTLCTIPIRETTSYNLGQAVAIALYELEGKERYHKEYSLDEIESKTTVDERETLHRILRNSSAEKLWRHGDREVELRRMIDKMTLTKDELHFLIGVVSSVNRG